MSYVIFEQEHGCGNSCINSSKRLLKCMRKTVCLDEPFFWGLLQLLQCCDFMNLAGVLLYQCCTSKSRQKVENKKYRLINPNYLICFLITTNVDKTKEVFAFLRLRYPVAAYCTDQVFDFFVQGLGKRAVRASFLLRNPKVFSFFTSKNG